VKHLIRLCTAAIAIAGAQPAVKPNGLEIFYHGKIFTSNPAQLLIEDGGVAVLDNIIVKVGSSNDAHVHPYDYFTFPEFDKGAAVVNGTVVHEVAGALKRK
jgi:hypothetical protein